VEHTDNPNKKRAGIIARAAPVASVIEDAGQTERIEQDHPSAADPKRPIHPCLQAMIVAARYHGVELEPDEFPRSAESSSPSAAALSLWAQNAGMWSRAVRIRWHHLLHMQNAGPFVLLLADGSAALVTGASAEPQVVFLKDPAAPSRSAPVAVDEIRISEVWRGEAVLLRASRGYAAMDAPFNLRWLAQLVVQERRSLRDIALASLTLSVLSIFPPLVIMTVVNKVLQFHSISTLVLLSAIIAVVFAYDTLLGYARRLIISVVGARLDTKLNIHLFDRLLRLPLDYFERHPAGETMYRISQIYRVRQFLTGKLLTTFLDLVTLCVLLPFLFYLNATLAWIVVACSVLIMLIILAFLKPLRIMYARVAAAETWKSATLGDHRRHQDGEGSRVGAPAQSPMGRPGRRGRQVEPGFRKARQLAADPGEPDRAPDGARHHAVRRLSGDERPLWLHGRRLVRLHDAEPARRPAAGRSCPAGRGLRRGQRGDQ